MNAHELEQYKHELIAEHEAEIAAIDRLIARERNKPNGASVTAPIVTTPRVRHRRTIRAIVREAVSETNGQFTRNEIQAHIADKYPASAPDSRVVAVELWKLARSGEIQTVEGGRGRIPATYRRR